MHRKDHLIRIFRLADDELDELVTRSENREPRPSIAITAYAGRVPPQVVKRDLGLSRTVV
jgi:hypothetical protein